MRHCQIPACYMFRFLTPVEAAGVHIGCDQTKSDGACLAADNLHKTACLTAVLSHHFRTVSTLVHYTLCHPFPNTRQTWPGCRQPAQDCRAMAAGPFRRALLRARDPVGGVCVRQAGGTLYHSAGGWVARKLYVCTSVML